MRRSATAGIVCAAFAASGCFITIEDLRPGEQAAGTGGTSSGGSGGSNGLGGASGGESTASGGRAGGGGEGSGGSDPLGPNLIENGDFSMGETGWDNGDETPGPPEISNGAGCTSGTYELIGWGGSTGGVTLEPGTYLFSFRMSAGGGATFISASVAKTVDPYTAVFTVDVASYTPTMQHYEYEIMLTEQKANMGLAFRAQPVGDAWACFDDVALRPILDP